MQFSVLSGYDGATGKWLNSLDICRPHESVRKNSTRAWICGIIIVRKERDESWVASKSQVRRCEVRRHRKLAARGIVDFVGLVQFATPDMSSE